MASPVVFENVGKTYPLYHHFTGGIKNFIFNLPSAVKALRTTRFEALRGGERMDLFVPQGAELPPGASVVETGIPAEIVLKANLLSSRGETGSNPELVEVLTEGETFMRVLAPREALEAPFSKAAYEVEKLRGLLASQGSEDRRKEVEGYIESPGFRDLSVSEQRRSLLALAGRP